MPESKGGFWSSIPGLITGMAGLLTGIVGMVTVLIQLGVFESGNDDEKEQAEVAATQTDETTVVTNSRGSAVTRGTTSTTGNEGGAVRFTVTPTSLNFSQVTKIGTVTVANTGDDSLKIDVTLSGEAFVASGCSADVDPGESCKIEVRFAPPSAGSHSGTLSVGAEGSKEIQQVILRGSSLL